MQKRVKRDSPSRVRRRLAAKALQKASVHHARCAVCSDMLQASSKSTLQATLTAHFTREHPSLAQYAVVGLREPAIMTCPDCRREFQTPFSKAAARDAVRAGWTCETCAEARHDAIRREHYRWYTVSWGPGYVKLGPVSLGWVKNDAGRLVVDVTVLCRWSWTVLGSW